MLNNLKKAQGIQYYIELIDLNTFQIEVTGASYKQKVK